MGSPVLLPVRSFPGVRVRERTCLFLGNEQHLLSMLYKCMCVMQCLRRCGNIASWEFPTRDRLNVSSWQDCVWVELIPWEV